MSATPNNVVALRPAQALDTQADLATIATTINTAHQAANSAATAAVNHARIAGAALLQGKSLIDHGGWLTWLDTNCPTIARRTAQAYMQLAEACDKSPAIASELSAMPVRRAMQLLAERRKPKVQRVAHPRLAAEGWVARQRANAAKAANNYVSQ